MMAVGDEQGQVGQGLVGRMEGFGLRYPVEALIISEGIFKGLQRGRGQGLA